MTYPTPHAARLIGLLAGALLTAGLASPVLPDEPIPYRLDEASKLWFSGTSTMHDWVCEASRFEGHFGLDATPALSDVEVSVPLAELACGSGMMENRLRATLLADEHPHVRYVLERATLAPLPDSSEAWFTARTSGRLTVAGAERIVEIEVTGHHQDDGRVRVYGSAPLRMTDFGIEPPQFLQLKTGDDVTVYFDVVAGPEGVSTQPPR